MTQKTEDIGATVLLNLDQIVLTFSSPEENPNKMEPERFELLVAAVQKYGVLQTVLVRKLGTNNGRPVFKLIDGHHRYWAVQKAGRTQLLGQIADVDDVQGQALGYAMNRLRGDLDLRMSADAIKDIIEVTGWGIETITVATGFTADEINALLGKDEPTAQDLLGEGAELGDESTSTPSAFVLEIEFQDRDAYKLAKRKLKKAAGKGGDLARGLLNVLGEE